MPIQYLPGFYYRNQPAFFLPAASNKIPWTAGNSAVRSYTMTDWSAIYLVHELLFREPGRLLEQLQAVYCLLHGKRDNLHIIGEGRHAYSQKSDWQVRNNCLNHY